MPQARSLPHAFPHALPRLAGLLLTILLATGTSASAGEAPKPSETASAFAQGLVAARQANAKAQSEGRASVWMAVAPSKARPLPAGTGR